MASFLKLADNLGELATIPSRISKNVAARIKELIKVQFATGQDPYGQSWKELLPSTVRRKKGDSRILLRSDRLSIETFAKPSSGAGISLVSVDYGGFHQSGTKHMASRPILPARSDLPTSWQSIIREELHNAMSKK